MCYGYYTDSNQRTRLIECAHCVALRRQLEEKAQRATEQETLTDQRLEIIQSQPVALSLETQR